jgi:hypothetical protein
MWPHPTDQRLSDRLLARWTADAKKGKYLSGFCRKVAIACCSQKTPQGPSEAFQYSVFLHQFFQDLLETLASFFSDNHAFSND